MGNHEVAREALAHPLRELRARNGRGIGADDTTVLADFFELLEHILLYIQVFENYLDNPVRLGDAAEMVLQVAGPDALGKIRMHQRCRLRPGQLRNRAARQHVRVLGAFWDNVE